MNHAVIREDFFHWVNVVFTVHWVKVGSTEYWVNVVSTEHWVKVGSTEHWVNVVSTEHWVSVGIEVCEL